MVFVGRRFFQEIARISLLPSLLCRRKLAKNEARSAKDAGNREEKGWLLMLLYKRSAAFLSCGWNRQKLILQTTRHLQANLSCQSFWLRNLCDLRCLGLISKPNSLRWALLIDCFYSAKRAWSYCTYACSSYVTQTTSKRHMFGTKIGWSESRLQHRL